MNYNNWNKSLFMMILISSTLFTISSNSLINSWMGLELNLMAFIYLIHKNLNMTSKITIKYFLIQSLASMNFLFIIIMMDMNLNMNVNNFINIMMISIINFSMLMKLGAAPFQWWFPLVTETLNWTNVMILLTWQKLAPMVILFYNMNYLLIMVVSLMSALIGAYSGLNQTSLRKILTYSSINHMSWMMINLLLNINMWKFYFMIYSYMNFIIILFLNKFNISSLNQIFFSKMNSPIKIMIFMSLLSLGGIPPLLGFASKWMTMKIMMMYSNFQFIMIFMIMCSLITLFYYLQITYSSILLENSNFFYSQMFFKKKMLLIKLNIISWVMLNMMTLIFMLF